MENLKFLQKYKFVDDEDLANRIVSTNVNLNKYGKNKIKQNPDYFSKQSSEMFSNYFPKIFPNKL